MTHWQAPYSDMSPHAGTGAVLVHFTVLVSQVKKPQVSESVYSYSAAPLQL
jgi:hypothetical protein